MQCCPSFGLVMTLEMFNLSSANTLQMQITRLFTPTATAGHLGLISGDIACSAVGLDSECKGSLVCTQHAGCSCLPGWKGISCDEGMFYG